MSRRSLRGSLGPACGWLLTFLLAAGLFFLLSWWALALHLDRSATAHLDRLESGWSWAFDDPEDIVHAETGLNARISDGLLSGRRGEEEGFVSLNFRGERIDARVYRHLRMRIYSERPTLLRLFHRESLDSPIVISRAAPIPIAAGWQTLNLDLVRLPWVALQYDNAGKVTAGPLPSEWGGVGGTVATLRIHPGTDPQTDFAIDSVVVSRPPDVPLEPIPAIAMPALAGGDLPRLAIVEVEPFSDTPGGLLETIDRMEQERPAFVYFTDLGWPPVPGWVWLLSSLALLGAGTFAPKRHTGVLLAGLVAGAAYGLSLPPGAVVQLALAIALVLGGAIGIYFQLPPQLSRRKVGHGWRAFGILLTVLLVPLVVLRTFVDGPTAEPLSLFMRLALYLPWAAAQQALLQWVFIPALGGHRRRLARTSGAALFGLLHFPNFALMMATLLLGAVTAHHYRRFRALLAVALLHAILGALYLELLPSDWLRSGAVGMRFFGAY